MKSDQIAFLKYSRMFVLSIIGFVIAACEGEPRLADDTYDNFIASYESIMASESISKGKRLKFQSDLREIQDHFTEDERSSAGQFGDAPAQRLFDNAGGKTIGEIAALAREYQVEFQFHNDYDYEKFERSVRSAQESLPAEERDLFTESFLLVSHEMTTKWTALSEDGGPEIDDMTRNFLLMGYFHGRTPSEVIRIAKKYE